MPIAECHGEVADHGGREGTNANTASDSVTPLAPFCAGCRDGIFDQYFLCVSEEAWHCRCLKCSVCGVILDCQMTCYYKDGRILCKDDYYKRCRTTKCTGCGFPININELVMKIRECVYHLACFRCCICTATLQTGDQFGMRDNGLIYCHRHHHLAINERRDRESSVCPSERSVDQIAEAVHTENEHQNRNNSNNNSNHLGMGGNFALSASVFLPAHMDGYPEVNHTGKHRSSKTRARRRKNGSGYGADVGLSSVHEQTLESMDQDSSMHLIPRPMTSSSGDSSPGAVPSSSSPSLQMAMLHSQTDSSSPSCQQNQRTKRMRTSFKHQQLRSMKQYFGINHNPDAKDLKQLAQKTGLTKRVLQVWFQNARAKYRRSLLKQDPTRAGLHSPSDKGMPVSPRLESNSPNSFITSDAKSNADLNHYPMSNASNQSHDTVNEFY